MKKIIHGVHIHTPPSKVYSALTTQQGLSGWWTTKVSVDERVGGIVDFTFMDGFNPDMEQVRLEPGRMVEWKCIAGHDNWRDNTFSFALDERDNETWLMFEQVYANELDDETYGRYNFNWGYYLMSLKKLCEEGQGTPFDPASR